MSTKNVPDWVKPVFELGPILVFFGAFFYYRNQTVELFGQEYQGLVMATVIFVPVLLAAMAALWMLTGKLSGMQVLTAVLVLVMGGLTIWLNDPKFIKMKPTYVYLALSAILVFGIMNGRSYLKTLMSEAIPMLHDGWMILTRRVAIFFVGIAMLNEVVWRYLDESIWVTFRTFGIPVLIILFFIAQMRLFRLYEDDLPE